MSIQRLNQGTPTSASQIPFYDTTNGVDRRCSLADLLAAAGLGESDVSAWMTQYAAPSASGFTVALAPELVGQSVWLLMTPAASYAAGTVTLPSVAECLDRQEVEIRSTQPVATLTITSAGATVSGATALLANTPVKLRFDIVSKTWFSAV